MKRVTALLMALMLLVTALPAYGVDSRGRIAKVYYHVDKLGDDYSVVGRPRATTYPEYADGTKDNVLIEHTIYSYYNAVGVDEITGIAYYDANGNLGPIIPLSQTEWKRYAGYIPFSVKKNAAAGSNVTGHLDDTFYIVEKDDNGKIISMFPVKPGSPDQLPTPPAQPAVAALKSSGAITPTFFKDYWTFMTRDKFAMLSVVLYEMLRGEKVQAVPPQVTVGFSDTRNPSVLQASALGLISGQGGGMYNPDSLMSREEAAVLLVQTCAKAGYPLKSPSGNPVIFEDQEDISEWAQPSIRILYANGIMKSTNKKRLEISPQGNITREKALVMVYEILLKAGKIQPSVN